MAGPTTGLTPGGGRSVDSRRNLHRSPGSKRSATPSPKATRADLQDHRPTLSRGEAVADAIRQVLNESVDPEAVLLHFASTVTDDESKVLRSGLRRRKRPR